MSRKLNIAVMLGGPSAERQVSLRSGAAVAQALRSRGHEVSEIDPKDGTFVLPRETDAVFLALHGTYGEDGTVQRQLDKLGVPYTGCDAESSALAFNKIASKVRFLDANVPTAKYWWADMWTDDANVQAAIKRWAEETAGAAFSEAKLSLPLVVKPACQGSSVGLQFVEQASDLPNAIIEAFKLCSPILAHGEIVGSEKAATDSKGNSQVLIEEKIIGRETTVGILDGQALPVVEVRPKAGAYDYRSKYTAGCTEYFCPADFDPATTEKIQAAALGAFHAIGGRDYARVDVMVRADGSPVVLEVNTLPGMTGTSLLPKAAAAAGLGYAELCQRMIDLALKRTAAQKRKGLKKPEFAGV